MFLALLLAGCPTPGADDTGGAPCAEYAAASVTIHVTNEDGEPLTPTSVAYSIDGGDTREAQCVNEACTEWVAGWEETGTFHVVATYHPEYEDPECWYEGYDDETVVVEMGEDGCHVVGQEVTLVLDDHLVCADGTA